MAKSGRPRREESSQPAARNSRTTVSGPADAGSAEAAVDTLARKLVGTDELSVSLPFNPLKASEYEPQVLEAGTHSLVWDEAVKISGADPDFHRRDLWEAIEAGAYPEYEPGLMNVASELATAVATGLGIREMPAPMPRAMTHTITPEVSASSALSLFARPGDGTIRARRVAVLVADGCDAEPLLALTNRLIAEGAVSRFVSTRLGPVDSSSGETIEVDVSLEAAPSVRYDAVVLPSGASAITTLREDGRTLELVKDQYRHCKPLLALNGADSLLQACGINPMLPTGEADPGVIVPMTDGGDAFAWFVAAIAQHRHFQRETDPPRV